jgi:thiamine-phosphate pyrophosphorylase
MAETCLFYYITDRSAFGSNEGTRRQRLLEKITEAARAGVDYIQLREKDLPTRDLESLARETVDAILRVRTDNRELRTALLINSRTDVALAVGADGVHLRSDDVSPVDVRAAWKACGEGATGRKQPERDPLIGVSCHSPREVARAAASGATFAVFAPVFEKKDAADALVVGLALLHEASRANIPVLALGGLTLTNARSCLEAGAAGVAAIRLFQENDIAAVVKHVRG